MKNRKGFTLVELIVAVLIFSFIATSLATISSTATRHMFQNYRGNVIKTNSLLTMRAIQNNLSVATRIDFPAPGAAADVLGFATNVDQASACYPISAASPAAWHYFCRAADPLIPGSFNLYYHTAELPVGVACGNPNTTVWNLAYNVPVCGGAPPAGVTVTLMMRHVSMPLPPLLSIFSRRPADGVIEDDTVRVTLRSFWTAATRGLGTSQRDVDFNMDTVIKVNRSR